MSSYWDERDHLLGQIVEAGIYLVGFLDGAGSEIGGSPDLALAYARLRRAVEGYHDHIGQGRLPTRP